MVYRFFPQWKHRVKVTKSGSQREIQCKEKLLSRFLFIFFFFLLAIHSPSVASRSTSLFVVCANSLNRNNTGKKTYQSSSLSSNHELEPCVCVQKWPTRKGKFGLIGIETRVRVEKKIRIVSAFCITFTYLNCLVILGNCLGACLNGTRAIPTISHNFDEHFFLLMFILWSKKKKKKKQHTPTKKNTANPIFMKGVFVCVRAIEKCLLKNQCANIKRFQCLSSNSNDTRERQQRRWLQWDKKTKYEHSVEWERVLNTPSDYITIILCMLSLCRAVSHIIEQCFLFRFLALSLSPFMCVFRYLSLIAANDKKWIYASLHKFNTTNTCSEHYN